MILHQVKCEMCEQHFDFNPSERIARYIPGAWLTLSQGNPERHNPLHFCSKRHLRSWLTEQLTANDIPLTMDTDHAPYEYCCPRHYPMPERKP